MLGLIIILSAIAFISFYFWHINNFWYNWYNKRPSSKMNLYLEDPHFIQNKRNRILSFIALLLSFTLFILGIILWSTINSILIFISIIFISVLLTDFFFKKRQLSRRKDSLRDLMKMK